MIRSVTAIQNFEMLRAIYDFGDGSDKKLSFKTEDRFILHQTCSKERNWWQVIDQNGKIGYVPSNYVVSEEAEPDIYIKFLDKCIDNIKKGPRNSETHELLLKLSEKKKNAILLRNQVQSTQPQICVPTTNLNKNESSTNQSSIFLPQNDYKNHILEENIYGLVETVRAHTKLSHEAARVAVTTVVRGLKEFTCDNSIISWLNSIESVSLMNFSAAAKQAESSRDGVRLREILAELVKHKEDFQQRSWALHEDQSALTSLLNELIELLADADPAVCRRVLDSDSLTSLTQFYQMESRWTLRRLLLQAFGLIGGLDRCALTLLASNSVLPMELARDMISNPLDIHKQCCSALLFTMMLSMADPIPISFCEDLWVSFINFLLDYIENPPETDLDDQIPDLFTNLLLAFNLQFITPEENRIMSVLVMRGSAKILTEKLLLLFNREEDPVRVFEHEPAPKHSVLKIIDDLFRSKTTATLFYTNDLKVVIDIVVRQLSDLSPGETRRASYLTLLWRILRHTNYIEHTHRIDDLKKCFDRISREDDAAEEKMYILKIRTEFKEFFCNE